MKEKFLPLGTVVLLKKGVHKVMIIGYGVQDSKNPKKYFDYMACMFPEGVLSLENSFAFNHEDIKTIYHLGFEDESVKEFNRKMKEVADKLRQI